MFLKIKTAVILGIFILIPVQSSQAKEVSIEEWVIQLTQSPFSADQKWEISRKIVAEGKNAIPFLINFAEDTRVVGITYPVGGECMNYPPHKAIPKHCQKPSMKETLGDRSNLLLYQIITPSYTSPYTTRVQAKDLRGPFFIVRDWKKWWQKNQGLSLDQIHEKARKLMDQFWLRGYQKGSVEWN